MGGVKVLHREVTIALGGFATGMFFERACSEGQWGNWLFCAVIFTITVIFVIISIKYEKKNEEEIAQLKKNLSTANNIICDLAREDNEEATNVSQSSSASQD